MKRIQIVGLIAVVLLCACSAKVDQRGYIPADDWKAQIKPGSTKDEVLTALGSPSSQSTFGSETWYYISGRKEGTAFLKPEMVKQNVIRIEFDPAGNVAKIEQFDEKNSRDLSYVGRTTPTEGHTYGFFEQILGNIGRFNKSAEDSSASSRKSR